MKKFHNQDYIISNTDAVYLFKNKIKLRILCDHKRFDFQKFTEIWDENESQYLLSYNETKVLRWNF